MIPNDWNHFRLIDYHDNNHWAVVFISLSEFNEAFIWDELWISPEKNTTIEIAREIARKSKDYKFSVNLIDPLANKNQVNTNTTVTQDLNSIFHTFRKEGICTGGHWEAWDTKSTLGRDRIRERLINAALVGRPFNNEVVRDGRKVRLPTLWVFNTCKQVSKSLQLWRIKKTGGEPAQEWSHFCTAIEGVMKDLRFKPRPRTIDTLFRKEKNQKVLEYFKT